MKKTILIIGSMCLLAFLTIYVTTKEMNNDLVQENDPYASSPKIVIDPNFGDISGDYIDVTLPEQVKPIELTNMSDYVVRGSFISKSDVIVALDGSIVSIYTFRVDQKLKGNLKDITEISVVVPGGEMRYGDYCEETKIMYETLEGYPEPCVPTAEKPEIEDDPKYPTWENTVYVQETKYTPEVDSETEYYVFLNTATMDGVYEAKATEMSQKHSELFDLSYSGTSIMTMNSKGNLYPLESGRLALHGEACKTNPTTEEYECVAYEEDRSLEGFGL